MKKVLFTACFSAALLLSCSALKEGLGDAFEGLVTGNLLENGLLQGSNLQMGFAAGATMEEVSAQDGFTMDVRLNNMIINGGSAIVEIASPEQLKELYLQIGNEAGVYVIDLSDSDCGASDEICRREGSDYVYTASVVFTQDEEGLTEGQMGNTLTITVSGLSITGDLSTSEEKTVDVVEAQFGALQVSLSWNNADDLDFYVETPDGRKIYYGNRDDGNGNLDIDSQAACRTDGVRNENIYFDEPLGDGEYKVYVKVFTKCPNSYPDETYVAGATYSVSAFYNGRLFNFAGKNQQGRFDPEATGNNDTSARRNIGSIWVSGGVVDTSQQ